MDGYTEIFRKLLNGISVRTGVDYFDHRDYWDRQADKIVFTGEIDRFFNFQFGRLQWRSLRFETTRHDIGDYQDRSIINYTEKSIPYTRTVEHKHFNIERTRLIPVTHVTHEYPAGELCLYRHGAHHPDGIEYGKKRKHQSKPGIVTIGGVSHLEIP